jgi:threonine dehydratase
VPVSGAAVDSLGVRRVGRLAFDAAVTHNVQHIDVTDDAIIRAQLRAWEELRVGLEPGGATALAALLSGAYHPAEHEVVGVLCCGGNVDIAAMLNPAT